jgi:GT2 family glycosyltransferase
LLRVAPDVIDTQDSAEADWVTGASFMIRAQALRDVGLFDDGFFLYFEEVELMHRLRQHGWTIRHVPASRVAHEQGASTGLGGCGRLPDYWYESRRRYFARTGGGGIALAANLAWLGGRPIGAVKQLLRDGKRVAATHAADLVRSGLWPRSRDRVASIPLWGEAPGRLPAWMRWE